MGDLAHSRSLTSGHVMMVKVPSTVDIASEMTAAVLGKTGTTQTRERKEPFWTMNWLLCFGGQINYCFALCI
jgi:hypothetical protein